MGQESYMNSQIWGDVDMNGKSIEEKSLKGYSELMNLQYTPEELIALENSLREMNEDIAKLWDVDVENIGLAYFFHVDWEI